MAYICKIHLIEFIIFNCYTNCYIWWTLDLQLFMQKKKLTKKITHTHTQKSYILLYVKLLVIIVLVTIKIAISPSSSSSSSSSLSLFESSFYALPIYIHCKWVIISSRFFCFNFLLHMFKWLYSLELVLHTQ